MDVMVLLALLLLLGGDSKPAPKKVPPLKNPDDVCPDGTPVEYDGPKVFGDIRKSDKAAGLTPAEQIFLATTLEDISDGSLVLTAGLCTRALLATAMQLPPPPAPASDPYASWEVVLAGIVFGMASGKTLPKWPQLSDTQKSRIAMLTLAVMRHRQPPAADDLEDEASNLDGPRGSVSEDIAVAWTVANLPTSTPPQWKIPAPHNKQKKGQKYMHWYANYAYYWAYATAPVKILLPKDWAWVSTYNRIVGKVETAMKAAGRDPEEEL